MVLSEAQADYLVELFKVGLEEVAERVAVITEQPVTITHPKVFDGQSITQLADDLETSVSDQGTIATLPLHGGFEGAGILFLPAEQDKPFADLLAQHCDDQQSRDNALNELSKVLLEQYVVVMTDLLSLNIEYQQMQYERNALNGHALLVDGCSHGALCLSMSFILSDLDINCHIVFIHQPPGTELMNIIKTALANMGLAE